MQSSFQAAIEQDGLLAACQSEGSLQRSNHPLLFPSQPTPSTLTSMLSLISPTLPYSYIIRPASPYHCPYLTPIPSPTTLCHHQHSLPITIPSQHIAFLPRPPLLPNLPILPPSYPSLS